jgi:hypothetical protein
MCFICCICNHVRLILTNNIRRNVLIMILLIMQLPPTSVCLSLSLSLSLWSKYHHQDLVLTFHQSVILIIRIFKLTRINCSYKLLFLTSEHSVSVIDSDFYKVGNNACTFSCFCRRQINPVLREIVAVCSLERNEQLNRIGVCGVRYVFWTQVCFDFPELFFD